MVEAGDSPYVKYLVDVVKLVLNTQSRLFTSEEIRYINSYLEMEPYSQILFTRMSHRIGPWLRVEKLRDVLDYYIEKMSAPTDIFDRALENLIRSEFVISINSDTIHDDLSNILSTFSVDELKKFYKMLSKQTINS